jgi:exopolysaccharide biosynthesis polyprenyl glycosylphosphotransferase
MFAGQQILHYFLSFALIYFLIMVFFYLFPFRLGRGLFLINLILAFVFLLLWRITYSRFSRLALSPSKVLIVGNGKSTKSLFKFMNAQPEFKVVGMIGRKPPKKESDLRYLGDLSTLDENVRRYKVENIITTIEPAYHKNLTNSLLRCRMLGIDIHDIPAFYEKMLGKLPVQWINEKWFIHREGFENIGNKFYLRVKRAIDLFLALFILIISVPLSAILALLIKSDSKGPVFYSQKRIGKNQKVFRLIKFRTMIRDAEKIKPVWASQNDTRMTRIGKILRKTRLDELPQMINIIKGEMSFIGPRPERPYFVKKLNKEIPFYSIRSYVKPGLTGWAQVNNRYAASNKETEEKLGYDLFYIKNMSFLLDTAIYLKTIRISLFGMGR